MSADHKKEDVFTEAPLLLIEILSREDEMGEVLDKCDDYYSMGVRNIVVADPYRKRLFIVDQHGRLSEGESLSPTFELHAGKPALRIDFENLFDNLD